MADTFQWKATATFKTEAPNTTLTSGAINAPESWQTATIGDSGSGSWDYYFHDANNTNSSGWFTDDNSTRVRMTITQSWTTSVDDHNNLTINMTTTLGPVVRDDKRGVCNNLPARQIDWYTREGGPSILSLYDNQVGTPRTLYSGTITLPTYTITIAPGTDAEKASIYVHNETVGYGWYDDVWAGVQFKNTLPADYRPGAVNDSGVWKSHDRTGGKCHVYNGAKYIEMRTQGAPTAMGNPPSTYKSSKWYNMAKLGKM